MRQIRWEWKRRGSGTEILIITDTVRLSAIRPAFSASWISIQLSIDRKVRRHSVGNAGTRGIIKLLRSAINTSILERLAGIS